jgi:hypothetical protein
MAERASNPAGAVVGDGAAGAHFEAVRLKYCERCGALGIQPVRAGGGADATPPGHCNACREALRWLAGEVGS